MIELRKEKKQWTKFLWRNKVDMQNNTSGIACLEFWNLQQNCFIQNMNSNVKNIRAVTHLVIAMRLGFVA